MLVNLDLLIKPVIWVVNSKEFDNIFFYFNYMIKN